MNENEDFIEVNNNRNFKTATGREIHYYGEEHGDSIKRKDGKQDAKIQTLNDFFEILLKSWSKETAYPGDAKSPDFNLENDPTFGQCAITATLVYDMFGGTIHKVRNNGGGTHYFNKIDGHYIDLTRDQFDLYNIPIEYEPNEEIPREYCGKNENTLKRYKLLIERIKNNL